MTTTSALPNRALHPTGPSTAIRPKHTLALQVLTAATILPAQKPLQNREIQELFGRFRSVKSFVGRDQLRENLFIK